MEFKQNEFAKKIGVSRQYISKLVKEGKIILTKEGKVNYEEYKNIKRNKINSQQESTPKKYLKKNQRKINIDNHEKSTQEQPVKNDHNLAYNMSRAKKEYYLAETKKEEYLERKNRTINMEDAKLSNEIVIQIFISKMKNLIKEIV